MLNVPLDTKKVILETLFAVNLLASTNKTKSNSGETTAQNIHTIILERYVNPTTWMASANTQFAAVRFFLCLFGFFVTQSGRTG